jgi:hypothetical protein
MIRGVHGLLVVVKVVLINLLDQVVVQVVVLVLIKLLEVLVGQEHLAKEILVVPLEALLTMEHQCHWLRVAAVAQERLAKVVIIEVLVLQAVRVLVLLLQGDWCFTQAVAVVVIILVVVLLMVVMVVLVVAQVELRHRVVVLVELI